MRLLTENAKLVCLHELGKVDVEPSQSLVRIDRRLALVEADPEGRRVVAYCHSGQRSELAAALLRAAGIDAVNYEGSWHEWSRRHPAG